MCKPLCHHHDHHLHHHHHDHHHDLHDTQVTAENRLGSETHSLELVVHGEYLNDYDDDNDDYDDDDDDDDIYI